MQTVESFRANKQKNYISLRGHSHSEHTEHAAEHRVAQGNTDAAER